MYRLGESGMEFEQLDRSYRRGGQKQEGEIIAHVQCIHRQANIPAYLYRRFFRRLPLHTYA
jgi:hypothetical protein